MLCNVTLERRELRGALMSNLGFSDGWISQIEALIRTIREAAAQAFIN